LNSSSSSEFDVTMLQEIARHLRPRTLRAQFGKDKIRNALHCTDLPEDGLLEVTTRTSFLPSLVLPAAHDCSQDESVERVWLIVCV
jgi:hypothetical protein